MARRAPTLLLSGPETVLLEEILGNPREKPELTKRARFLLMTGSGSTNLEASQAVNINKGTASRWRHAVIKKGLEAFLKEAEELRDERQRVLDKRQLPKRPRGRPRKDYVPTVRPPFSEVSSLQTPLLAASEMKRDHPALEGMMESRGHITGASQARSQPEASCCLIAGIYLAPPNFGFVLAHLPKETLKTMTDEEALAADDFESPPPLLVKDPVRVPVRLVSAIFYNQSRLQRQLAHRYDPAGWLGFLQQIESEWPEPARFEIVTENINSYTYQNPDLRAWLVGRSRFQMRVAHGPADWVRVVEERLLEVAPVPPAVGMEQWLKAAEALEAAAAMTLAKPKPIQWVGTRGEPRWLIPSSAHSTERRGKQVL